MLLILREEIICAIILLFLIFYYLINKVKDKDMLFLKISVLALIYVFFDAVTVISVNHRDLVSDNINRILHIGFYITGLLFSIWFYNYITQLTVRYKYVKKMKAIGYFIFSIFVLSLLFLPMEYVEGNGTNYSYGPLAISGYALFLLYCTACVIMLFINRKKLDRKVRRALIPMLIAMYFAVILQAIIPELLMTGGNVTLICIALFVALDNPDKDFMKQALWDFSTGLNNRNCYNRDLAKYIDQAEGKKRSCKIGFVVCDINYLKTINDKYGHAEGDKLLAAAADTLRTHLKSAENIYRLGGDEFVAIYLSKEDSIATTEMEHVQTACSSININTIPLSIAMGYASGFITEDVDAILNQADQNMYEHKTQIKKKAPHLSPFR